MKVQPQVDMDSMMDDKNEVKKRSVVISQKGDMLENQILEKHEGELKESPLVDVPLGVKQCFQKQMKICPWLGSLETDLKRLFLI